MSAAELRVERLIDAPIDAVWTAWTEHTAEWWCPKPWTTEIVAWDLRAGGRSSVVMRGPNGEEAPMDGLFLEVEPGRRVVFTNAFTQGWVPQATTPMIAGFMEFAPEGDKTRYVGRALHWSEEAKAQHEAMGFVDGWGAVAAQLEEVAKRVAGRS